MQIHKIALTVAKKKGGAVGTGLLTVLAACLLLYGWYADPHHPQHAAIGDGWWGDYDQSHYLRAALSFSHGEFSAREQWYLPLYPLLAAPFVWLGLPDPFLPLNMACLIAAVILSGALARCVLPEYEEKAALVGMGLFVLCDLFIPFVRQLWSTPWTSTLAVPLMLASILACLRWIDRPVPVTAFACGFWGALVGGVRPVDGALLLAVCGCCATLRLFQRPTTILSRSALLSVVAIMAGTVLGAMPTLLLYWSIWGIQLSPYLYGSKDIGFGLDLLGLHWVEIMISPRPALPIGTGMIEALPFIATGLAGMLAALLFNRRLTDILLAAAVMSSVLLFLCYRDLHAPGIWAYHNAHYFKWTFAIFSLYTIVLLKFTVQKLFHFCWILPVLIASLCWRAVPVREGKIGHLLNNQEAVIDLPEFHPLDAIAIPASGPADQIYFGVHELTVGNTHLRAIADYKAFPIPNGVMIQPLRAWPAGQLSVKMADGISLEENPYIGRIALTFELPCWTRFESEACTERTMLPAEAIQPNTVVAFSSPQGKRIAIGGWFPVEPNGRWTEGKRSLIQFRAAGHSQGWSIVHLEASALSGARAPIMSFRVQSHGEIISNWTWRDGLTHGIDIHVPAVALAPDGTITLELQTLSPQRPSDVFPPSTDGRELGLFMHTLSWRPD